MVAMLITTITWYTWYWLELGLQEYMPAILLTMIIIVLGASTYLSESREKQFIIQMAQI